MMPDSLLGCGNDNREYSTRNKLHLDPGRRAHAVMLAAISTLLKFLGPSIGKNSVHDEFLLQILQAFDHPGALLILYLAYRVVNQVVCLSA